MSDCQHATVALPDPLPEPIEAALRLSVGPADGLDISMLIDRIGWAVHAVHLTAVALDRYKWTPSAACAVLRRHPAVAAVAPQVDKVLCGVAAKVFEVLPQRTELGLAERIAVLCGGDLAWSTTGAFAVWDGGRWRVDETGAMAVEQAKRVVRTLLPAETNRADTWVSILARDGVDEKDPRMVAAVADAKAARAFAKSAQSARTIRAALELLRGEPGVHVPADQWDARPDLLSVGNGTVELRDSGEAKLREHRREDRLTRITRADYRPRADRVEWDRFLADVLPDEAVRARVQKLAGYSLQGGNPERLLIVLLGQTTTGKSTFVEALAHALGEYGGGFDLGLFRGTADGGTPRADLVAALPRRFLQTTEASDRWELHADAIKRLTGGDTIAARQLYSRVVVERRPAFTAWLATNAAPRIIGADDALWRRLEVLPFDTKITKEDPGLARRLRDDYADAVLAWAVEGWKAYAREGLGPAPAACLAAAARLRTDLSLVDTWLAERCDTDPDATAPPQALADDWQSWCTAMHVPERERVSSVALGRALTARGYPSVLVGTRTDRQRVRRGLRLVDEHPPSLRAVPKAWP